MLQLNPTEARVLGVVIEKSLTVPDQYPMSLNGVTNGCNQKNNRDPVTNLTEDECFEALETLRDKQLIVRVDQVGARVPKFKHMAVETLKARTAEIAVLAELLLRGPQTMGELRTRASRMSPLESLDRVRDMIRALQDRPEPFVMELPPSPGSRAERYVQLLSIDLHPIESVVPNGSEAENVTVHSSSAGTSNPLATRVEHLEQELAVLKAAMSKLANSLGESDPFPPAISGE